LSPQGIADAAEVAERILPYAHVKSKPVLASWMGGASVEHGEQILKAGGIPAFAFPDSAARAFVYMWQYTENLRALYETPEGSEIAVERETVATILEAGRAAGRTLLTEVESKRLLAAYGVPVTNTQLATTREEATRFAGTIDGSVVLKLYSHSITHKTDVGGVELDLRGEDAVGAAWDRIQHAVSAEHFEGVTVQPMIRASGGYELILGSSTDAQFGPVLLFGAGGQLVEIFGDRSLGLPPLNSTLARRMMERTKIYKALGGVRGRKPVDLAALELLLVRFSQLVSETPRIREIDINPLLVSADTMVALDARVVLHDWNIAHRDLPRTAIRPYPAAYVKQVTLKDGTSVRIRPIRPEDEPAMVGFHESLSERSVYFRYFHHMRLDQRVAHERLTRICFIDYDREVVLVGETSEGSIIAAARLSKEPGSADGEFAILVADAWQTHGLGTILLQTLVDIARKEGLRRVSGMILSENRAMQEICRELGFQLGYSPEEGLVEASLMFD